MRIIYTLGIYAYTLAVRLAAPFNIKARQMVQGWKRSHRQIWLWAQDLGHAPVAWFHVASLGEFEQARPVLEKFRTLNPAYKVLLTFFSPSGYEVRKDYQQADMVAYLPMDTPSNARWLVQTVMPRVAFFVKYDFWFNYLNQLRSHNSKTYIFSAIFRPTHYFFRWYGHWFLHQLRTGYDHIFVQNQESLQLLQSHGIDHCTLTGDTRFDRVYDIAQKARRVEPIETFIDATSDHTRRPVLMAGSSWEPDEQFIKQYLDYRKTRLKVILAPHMIGEGHIQSILHLFGPDNCIRFSALHEATPEELKRDILIIDNIGMLSALYRYADVAYIGGGWGRGIHNTLEAVAFGKPVVFGPNYHKFQEAHDLIRLGGGYTYDRYDTLQTILDRLIDNADAYQKASLACTEYLNNNLGSSDKIISKTAV